VAEERAAAFVTRLAEAGVRRQPEVEAALTGLFRTLLEIERGRRASPSLDIVQLIQPTAN